MSSIKEETGDNNFDCEVTQPFDSRKASVSNTNFPPTDLKYPILTKELYHTEPPLEELHSMTDHELSAVRGFKVYNQFGSIEWIGLADLTGVNLDTCVHIRHENAEVYPEDCSYLSKPERGQKLNIPAIITLEGLSFGKCKTSQEANLAC